MSKAKIKKIALTGVMGAGKSSVIRVLREQGVAVFDCDEINHELLQIGEQGYTALVEVFGDTILDASKAIDRAALADLMFAKGKRLAVEGILHPLIQSRLFARMEACTGTLAVAEVPLLFEIGWQNAFDETWVVACEEELVLSRLHRGRGIDREEAKRRLRAQLSQKEKIALCDVVLYNNDDEEALRRQVIACVKRAKECSDEGGGRL